MGKTPDLSRKFAKTIRETRRKNKFSNAKIYDSEEILDLEISLPLADSNSYNCMIEWKEAIK